MIDLATMLLSEGSALNDQPLLDEAKLDLASAEVAARHSREQLNTLLGLSGADTQWKLAGRLPEIPDDKQDTKDIETVAVTRSVDLEKTRLQIRAASSAPRQAVVKKS